MLLAVYNGVAILSRHPMETVAKALVGDDSDTHARFLEVIIKGIRIVNIYLPNGNPVGSEKFAYKLAWMERLHQQMIRWKQDDVPTLIGGDFNVIPGGHRLSQAVIVGARCFVSAGAASPLSCDVEHWAIQMRFGRCTWVKLDTSRFGITFGRRSKTIEAYESITSCYPPTLANRLEGCEIDKGPRGQEKPSDHTPIIVTLSDLP